MTETPYNRYKRVLAEIAAGADDPQNLAIEALRSRKPIVEPKIILSNPKRETSKERALRNYYGWVTAGKPHWNEWAKTVGLARSTAARWVRRGEHHLERENYLRSKQHKEWCDEQIAMDGWDHFKEVWGWRSELYEQLWGVPDGVKPLD